MGYDVTCLTSVCLIGLYFVDKTKSMACSCAVWKSKTKNILNKKVPTAKRYLPEIWDHEKAHKELLEYKI